MTKLMSYISTEGTKTATTEKFGRELQALGNARKDIVALTADLKGSVKIGYFGNDNPDRIFDVGIAEQNMIGMAAGMAKCGLVPFAATFSVFSSLRALDQIHTDICYQNLNVKLIGTHGGTSFATGGATHHAIEDIAVLRSLANMTVICPADGIETALATRAAANTYGPFYIRFNRGTDYDVYNTEDYGFEIGKAVTVADGTDLTVIACGSCVYQAIKAAEILERERNLSVRILDMHTIKPIDKDAIIKAAAETNAVVTVEDHTIIGGLGGAVAEVLAENGAGCKFRRLGIKDKFSPTGNRDDILAYHEIDAAGIVKNVLDLLK